MAFPETNSNFGGWFLILIIKMFQKLSRYLHPPQTVNNNLSIAGLVRWCVNSEYKNKCAILKTIKVCLSSGYFCLLGIENMQ